MGIRESRYPKDWLDKAKKDLRRVKILYEADDTEGAGFNLQQAIEKSLKAFLLSRYWRLQRTHDLVKLLNFAVHYDRCFEKYRGLCQQATEYYLEDRYPIFYSSAPDRHEIEDGLTQASQLMQEVEGKLRT